MSSLSQSASTTRVSKEGLGCRPSNLCHQGGSGGRLGCRPLAKATSTARVFKGRLGVVCRPSNLCHQGGSGRGLGAGLVSLYPQGYKP